MQNSVLKRFLGPVLHHDCNWIVALPCSQKNNEGTPNRRGLSRLVITHKDRLLRFGAEIVFRICELKGIEVVIINKGEQPSFDSRMTSWKSTVFCAKLYGRRSQKSKKMAAEKQQLELNLGPPIESE